MRKAALRFSRMCHIGRSKELDTTLKLRLYAAAVASVLVYGCEAVDPGGAVLVAGRYTVKAVQSQVTLQGAAGRETWLGVDLLRGHYNSKARKTG